MNDEQARSLVSDVSAAVNELIIKKNQNWVEALELRIERDALLAEIEEVKKDRDRWKANHDNQVKLKQSISQRPDLGDRAARVAELVAEVEQLKAELAAAPRWVPVGEWNDNGIFNVVWDNCDKCHYDAKLVRSSGKWHNANSNISLPNVTYVLANLNPPNVAPNKDPDRLLEMAAKEDNGCISVGGLVCRVKAAELAETTESPRYACEACSGTGCEVDPTIPLVDSPADCLVPCKACETETRDDGVIVRKDRWEFGIRRIVALLWGNRKEFEIDDVVNAIAKMTPVENRPHEKLFRDVELHLNDRQSEAIDTAGEPHMEWAAMNRILAVFEIRDGKDAVSDIIRVCSVVMAIVLLLYISSAMAYVRTEQKWQDECAKRGFAEYDSVTREWRWKRDVDVTPNDWKQNTEELPK